MSPRTMLLVVLALICGTSAVIVVYQLRTGALAPDTVPVLTAKVDVLRGSVLDAELVKISHYPRQHVPNGALASLDEAAGRAVLFPLAKGEPIVQSRLTPKNGGHGPSRFRPRTWPPGWAASCGPATKWTSC
jgi:pilus assembly protein CpaB